MLSPHALLRRPCSVHVSAALPHARRPRAPYKRPSRSYVRWHQPPSDEVAFGFNARSTVNGFSGQCTVVDLSTQPRTLIKCVDVTALVQTPLPSGGGTATFFGNATVNGVPTTYRIDVADVAEPGTGGDTFSIQTSGGYTAAGPLTRGNIQVHR